MIFILVQAGEGNTQTVFVAQSKSLLIATVRQTFSKELKFYPLPWSKGNQGYIEKERDALIQMLEQHSDWTEGRHILTNIEPCWEEHLLVIAAPPAGYSL